MNLKNILKNNLFKTLSATLFTRGAMALGSYVLMIVMGRLYGAEGVGVFALAQGITVGTVSMLARSGMHITLMRDVGRFNDRPESIVYLKWACQRAFIVSTILSLIIFLGRFLLENIFSSPLLASVLIGNAIATVPFTISYTMAGFFKGIRQPSMALTQENGMVAIWTCVFILFFHLVLEIQNIQMVAYVYALAAWIVMFYGIWKVWKLKKVKGWKKDPTETTISKKQFMKSSANFFSLNLLRYIQNRLITVVAGFFLSSSELGLLAVAQQSGRLIDFISMVINAIFPSRFASLYYENKLKELEKLARKSSLISIVFSFPVLFSCMVFPQWVLGLFGNDFPEAAILLQIIAVGGLVNLATGSIAAVLNMTGYEKISRNIGLVNAVIGLFLYFTLIPWLGALGAALSLSIVLILQNLAALYFVWTKLGVWVLPITNVFKININN